MVVEEKRAREGVPVDLIDCRPELRREVQSERFVSAAQGLENQIIDFSVPGQRNINRDTRTASAAPGEQSESRGSDAVKVCMADYAKQR